MRFECRIEARTPSSLTDAQLVVDACGIPCRTIEISAAVDGYLQFEPDADARRRGNVMARTRMVVLFDQSAKLDALADRNRKQNGTVARIFHVARRRYAAGQSDRRSLQEASLGARALSRRSSAPDRQGPDGRSRSRSDRRSRPRHQLRDAPTRFSRSSCTATRTTSSSSAASRRRRRARSPPRRLDALEASSTDDGDAQQHRDQRVLPTPGRLFEGIGEQRRSFR